MVTESNLAAAVRPDGTPVSVAAMITTAAKDYPATRIIYPCPEGERVTTYLETYEEALGMLGKLQQRGLRAGDVAVVALEDPQDFIPCLWACVLGGIVPCPILPKAVDVELWNAHLAHLSTLFDTPAFITANHNRSHFGDRRVFTLEELRMESSGHPALNESGQDELAFLMLSSGSTGAPKAIALTHGNILASMAGKRAATGITGNDVTMNWIAFDHVAALTECHLLPLYMGAVQVQISPVEVASSPVFFLQAISRYRVTHTFTPNFLLGQIVAQIETGGRVKDEIAALDLSSLRRIISGGEANVCATGARFLETFAAQGLSHSALWPAFGMTETCAGSIYSTIFENEIGIHEFASLGRPVRGLELRVQAETGQPAQPGEEGELQLRGDMIFHKYYANPEATAQAFTTDGWFRTGDLGLLDADTGTLRLVGRSKESIIVNGINYFLHELEAAIENLDGVAPSFVACFPTRATGSDTESLIIFYAPLDSAASAEQLRTINTAIRNVTVLHWGFRPTLVLPVGENVLSKTSLGKIQRSKLRKQYEGGTFDPLIVDFQEREAELAASLVPPATATEERVVREFSRITGIPEASIGATSSFFALGGTSLEILRLLSTVNALSDGSRRIALADLVRDPTPSGIATLVSRDTAARQGYDPVVPLQITGKQTPVFLLHPGVGEVLVFINLASFFTDERPVYALRARGFNPGECFFGSFDELVSSYVEAIQQRQEHGPYIIAGYSYGGPVALPIAQRLEAQGEIVHALVIDAPPVIEHPRGTVDRIESALMLSFFLGFIDKDQLDEYGQILHENPKLDPAEYLFTRAPASRIRELGQDLATFSHWNELAYGLSQIGAAHQPTGTIEDITVFYAEPIWGDKNDYLTTMLHKWDRHSRQPVSYVEIPGEHHTILSPRFVDKFQDALKSEIARLEDEDGTRS